MNTFALLRNATGDIEEYRQEAAGWSAPAHKFGPDYPTRWVPVVDLPVPAHDPATQIVVPTPAVLNGDVVERGWSVTARPVPEQVPLWALRQVCATTTRPNRNVTLKAEIDTAIAALPEPPRETALVRWEYKDTIRRSDELTLALAGLLGLTSSEVDGYFQSAAALT